MLSPGGLTLGPGPNNAIENDDLELVFVSPVKAFGFDVLFQSADFQSSTTIQVFNQANISLFFGGVPASTTGVGGAAGAAAFWGAVASGADRIARIVVNEADNDATNPDCNIGFDSLRIVMLLGDYNFNGVVDAADYVVWRKGLGTTYADADYNLWRSHFGETVSMATDSSSRTAVPEPSILSIAALVALFSVEYIRSIR